MASARTVGRELSRTYGRRVLEYVSGVAMPKLVVHVVCPSCHRRQGLKDGTTLPELWFDDRANPADVDFIHLTRAYGGQGRTAKGVKTKAMMGFVLEGTKTLGQAYQDPAYRDKVIALYRSSKKLVDYLESIGLK